eukprot:12844283-Ditylum_brightwellii.AAC.1
MHKFGSIIYCKAPLAIADQLNTNISANGVTIQSFESFLRELPAHVNQLLENLQADNVDVGYWIDAINSNLATITIDGSVADKKGYFATVLHTAERSIRFQGP